MVKGLQLRLGVDGAELSGVGNVDKLWLYHVFIAVLGQAWRDDFRRQLSGGRRQRKDFVSGALDGSGFMDVDVAGAAAMTAW